jgi:hypothetical protein
VGELEKKSGSITGGFIATAAPTVVNVDIHFEGSLDDLVGFFAFEVAEETDSARVVFVGGIVEALGFRET